MVRAANDNFAAAALERRQAIDQLADREEIDLVGEPVVAVLGFSLRSCEEYLRERFWR